VPINLTISHIYNFGHQPVSLALDGRFYVETLRHLGPLIPCIRKDAVDEGKQTARRPQHLAGTIAILHVGGVDDHTQQEAERIDEDVALASLDLLARIEALRIKRRAPF